MSSQQVLPPSGRDYEVYRLVRVEQRSTQDVAAALVISQTRICQVVQRVGEFLAQMAPPSVAPEDRGRQIHVAEQVAAERLNYLCEEAMRAFEQPKLPQHSIREVSGGSKPARKVVTIRTSAGDCRYLNMAMRLSQLAAKVFPPNLAGLLPAGALEVDDAAHPRMGTVQQTA